MRLFLTTLFLILCAGSVCAEDHDDNKTTDYATHTAITGDLRLGVNIGGMMPIGMPETIRGLNFYGPRFNPQLAGYVNIPLRHRFGLQLGVQVERKAMKTDARVATYKMAMVREGNTIAGVFTGNVHTEANEWGFTIPVLATYALSRHFSLRLGPYMSVLVSHDFHGYAYDGYMRLGDPTGERVDVGSEETNRGSYDFSSDMRDVLFGVDVGVDWYMTRKVGLYADLQWGLDGIFRRRFDTISQTMYPLYGTIGIFKVL